MREDNFLFSAGLFFGLFVLGTIFGSFGSVLLTRGDMPRTWKNIWGLIAGRSQCPHCLTFLLPIHLIPLISYRRNRGRCNHCAVSISSIYPVLEIISGLTFCLAGFFAFSWGLSLSSAIFFFGRLWSLGLLAVWDWYHGYLHILVWLFGIVCVALFHLSGYPVGSAWFSAVSIFGLFVFLYIAAGLYGGKKMHGRRGAWEEGLGEGDIWLLVLLFPGFLWIPPDFITAVPLYFCVSGMVGICFFLLKQYSVFANTHEGDDALGRIPFFPALIVTWYVILFLAM